MASDFSSRVNISGATVGQMWSFLEPAARIILANPLKTGVDDIYSHYTLEFTDEQGTLHSVRIEINKHLTSAEGTVIGEMHFVFKQDLPHKHVKELAVLTRVLEKRLARYN